MPSENETTVIEIFLGDYIKTRLCHQFMIEAGQPFLKFIDFFESRSVTAHLLFPKMVLLLCQHFSMFLKPGNRNEMTARQLLLVDYEDPTMQLSKKDIFVGSRVKDFVKKMQLTCDSPELDEFYDGVTR